MRQAPAEAMQTGFDTALAQVVLLAVACYHQAAFPRTGQGAVADEEAAELRWVAYQHAAIELLPTPVREAAARTLTAVDRGEPSWADSMLTTLKTVVHEQHLPVGTRRPARR